MMTDRKLASIEYVEEVKDIPDADRIQAYRVKGWWVVDKKDAHNPGDKVIYLEVDSWVPEELAPFLSKGSKPKEYNGVVGNRLRTVKLRNQLSQGLILPIDIAPIKDIDYSFSDLDVGTDVTDALGIQKWEPPIPSQLQGKMKGVFPSWIKKTDQERCQNIWNDIADNGWLDELAVIETKLDGSSMTVYQKDGDIGVCSRNIDLKIDQEDNTFVDTAKRLNLFDRLKEMYEETGKNIALQGELMGPGIQGNKENLSNHQFFLFDIFDIDNQFYLTHEQKMVICKMFDIDYVPVIYSKVTLRDIGVETLDDLLEMADGKSLNSDVREGIVIKSVNGDWSFKAINNKFLLKTNS